MRSLLYVRNIAASHASARRRGSPSRAQGTALAFAEQPESPEAVGHATAQPGSNPAHRAPHERTRSTLQQEKAVAARSGVAARPRRPRSVSKAQGRARGARARGSGERAHEQLQRLLERAVAAIWAAAEKRAARLPSLCLSAFSGEARSGSL